MARTLVLVDFENLAGHITPSLAAAALTHVLAPVTLPVDVDLVLGSQPAHADTLAALAGDPLVVHGIGPDGVDRALAAAFTLHVRTGRYDRLVIVSGDHFFARVADAAHAAGLTVEVVARTRSCARRLARAADVVHEVGAVKAALAAARA